MHLHRDLYRASPRAVTVALCVLTLVGLAVAPRPAAAVQIGDTAPEVLLWDIDGERRSLSDESGNVVLLFFLGHNAQVCRNAAAEVNDLYASYRPEGLQVFGIDCWDGTSEELESLRSDYSLDFPLLLSGSNAAADYDLPYFSFVVVDAAGRVAYVSAGPDAGAFDRSAIEAVVVALLRDASSNREATWGAIKTLYGSRKNLAGLF